MMLCGRMQVFELLVQVLYLLGNLAGGGVIIDSVSRRSRSLTFSASVLNLIRRSGAENRIGYVRKRMLKQRFVVLLARPELLRQIRPSFSPLLFVGDQLRIQPARGDQLIVLAAFDDPSPVHDEDLVAVPYGGQPVGHHDAGDAAGPDGRR